MSNNTEKKSSILKDALALTIITVVCSFALAFVYEITKAPIKAREDEAKNAGYQVVYADAESLSTDEELVELALEVDLSSLNPDYSGVRIDDVVRALDNDGSLLGYIVKANVRGYSSAISIAVGYSVDGVVRGMEILANNDTPGFGKELDNSDFKDGFRDVETDHFKLTKNSATNNNDIDVYSGSTVTTTAIVNAVNAGIGFLVENAEGLGGVANE